jgi:carbamoyl-phosphate synthase large subunit
MAKPSQKQKVVVLGGGPNRIGQGIEFDYCCVHASYALREEGYTAIMVNSNPETVSTDYDTSDRLYFEPLTREDTLAIIEKEKPLGVIVQFGGQTPLNLALPLMKAGVNILGTSPESIDRAEDRKLFKELIEKLDLVQPESGTAVNVEESIKVAKELGYPVLVRPSYVLGGRAMKIVYDDKDLAEYMAAAVWVSPERPVLVDKFLEDALEVDVDAISDGIRTVVCGVMEHIEEAGIHSGDSACALPPFSLSEDTVNKIRDITKALSKELKVIGLMNIQFAVKNDTIFVLEVNPRASRTIPFVSKATGIPWAKLATKVMIGMTLDQLGIKGEVVPKHVSVKEAVFPFNRFPGVDPILGPEMKSTGEVMGIDTNFGAAFIKSQLAAGQNLPTKGNVFISVKNKDKRSIVFIAKKLDDLGFKIIATHGTGEMLKNNDMNVTLVNKIGQGRPDISDLIKNGEIQLIINTPSGKVAKQNEVSIRAAATIHSIPLITTISGAQATVNGLEVVKKKGYQVKALQDYYK